MAEVLIPVLVGVACIIVGLLIGYRYRQNIAEAKIGRAEDSVKKLIDDAQKRAEVIKKETVLEAQEEVHKLRSEFDKETRERRNEITKTEKRLVQKEDQLDKKNENLGQKEDQLDKKTKEITKIKDDLGQVRDQQLQQLEHISGMTVDEAKDMLVEKVER